MNKKFAQLAVCFILGIGIQAGAYLYMDRVLFAPLSRGDYDMSDVKDKMAEAAEKEGKKLFAKVSVKGKAYYSHDYKYMADVTGDSVTIYKADDLGNPQNVDLKNQGVSFFEWMPDRNLALMALYPAHWKGGRWDVTLARYNPDGTTHESDAPIRDLPRNSKIVDVAYSTATNAVYMKMEVGKGLYRITGPMPIMIPGVSTSRPPILAKLPYTMTRTAFSTMTVRRGSSIPSMGMTAPGESFLHLVPSVWWVWMRTRPFMPSRLIRKAM